MSEKEIFNDHFEMEDATYGSLGVSQEKANKIKDMKKYLTREGNLRPQDGEIKHD